MTSPIVPDFILKLFEKEVSKINLIIVEKICELYKLDIDDVKTKIKKELNINFDVISDEIEEIKIVKKHKPKQEVSENNNTDLCIARIFLSSQLKVKQCSRHKLDGQEFCTLHHKLNQENKLKYGTIKEKKPDEISTEKLKRKVKRNIY